MHPLCRSIFCSILIALPAAAQESTTGFANAFRPEPPGTLLSHPNNNDSESTGRTTTLN